MAHYDLVIIGSGSGNALVSPELGDARVAVVEGGTFGGTCLNVGCIPTKMLVHTADVATTVRGAGRFGVDAALTGVRWRDVRDRVFGRIDPVSRSGLAHREESPATTPHLGWARFTGPRALAVTGSDGRTARVTGDQVVLATGSRPVVPEVVRVSGVPYETSDTVMRLDDLPARVVILGGGYIAAEFAHVLSALGSEVVIVTRGAGLLRHLDADVTREFTRLAHGSWEVHLGVEAEEVSAAGDGVRLRLTDGASVTGDLLLVATGRVPNSDDVGLEHAGVDVRDDGRVRVDAAGRTTAEGVWALGDVSAPYMLKHVANHESRVVAHNLAHPDDLREFDHRVVPSAVFTRPQIATVGLTEAEARAAGHDVTTYTQPFGDTAYGWAMEDTTSTCKLVADRTAGTLLGAHLMGPQSSTLIQPLIQAMSLGQACADLARGQYWIHPALSEVVENAVLGLGLSPLGDLNEMPVLG